MKRSYFKQKPRKPLKRTRLRLVGKSDTAEDKKEIQSLVREIVMKRDGGCILDARVFWKFDIPECNGYAKDGHLILQADHLVTRGNSATFADTRLVVCLCKGHHGWKSVGSNLRKAQYDKIVKAILPKARVALWEKMEADSWRATKKDWKLEIIALKQELKKLSHNT